MGKFNFPNQGQVLIWIIFVVVTVVLVTGGLYYYLQKRITPEIPEIKEIPAEEIIPEEKPAELLCQDECPQLDFKSCFNNSYKTCGNYDPDNCLEWSSIVNCPLNTICKNGECVETLSVSLSANPSGGSPPLKVELTAQVSGIETGPANYIFYCNRSDPGTDVIPGYNKKVDYVFSSSYTDVCNYSTAGTYTAKVIVERGGFAAEDRVEVTVTPLPDFSLSVNPKAIKAPQTGPSQSATIAITSMNDFSSAVTLSVTSGLPAGAKANFSPSSITSPPNGTRTSNFTVTTSNVTAGSYNLTIQGRSGSITKTTSVTLNVVDLSVTLTANPSSGNAPLNNVDLTATVSGSATGPINYRFDCTNDGIWDLQVNNSTFNPYTAVDLCNYSTVSTYTAKVKVERDVANPAEATITITLTASFDFSFSVSPSSGSVAQGGSVSATVTATLISGTTQSVSFSASGLPSGAIASFSPTSCNPTCSSTITINAASTTPTGTYLITITGTGGGKTKTTTFSLTVTTPPTLSVTLTADPSSGNAPLNNVDLTATVSGTATGPINYIFYCNRSDSGTNITPDYNHKKDGITTNPYTALDVCHYPSAGTYTPKVIVERGTLAAENRLTINVTSPLSPTSPIGGRDLDVTYIERTPRYYRYCIQHPNGIPTLCAGTENQKRWPGVGETITYTAHIINKGNVSLESFEYQWIINGNVVKSNSYSILGAGQEVMLNYTTTWPSSPETIQFKVDPGNIVPEIVETNNELTIGSHDLSISIWVERGLYNIFHNNLNLVGSYSFEDWIQTQFAKMNERFSQAKYSVAPNGILDRVRIDKIVVADNLDGTNSPMNSDPHLYLIDGRWQFSDGDATNAAGQGGAWQNYVDTFVNNIDWGLIHELAHQLGVIDLYRMNLANDPVNNMRFQVKDINGNVVPASQLPTYAWDQILFEHPGIMAGGDTSPYNDGTYFESHTAAGMNSHFNHRRGYYGEYLFDTPANNYLKILDAFGNPLISAQVALYQKDAVTEYFDNIPEITGTTDAQGIMLLPNRPVSGVTTATAHTLKDNPFGQINVVGTNGIMLVKVTKGGRDAYYWLFILDLNLAYWSGNKNSATYTIQTNL